MEDIEGYLKKYQKIVDYNNDNLEELRVLAKHTVKSQHLIIEKLQQENKQQKELLDKYEEKLMYALSPTTHEIDLKTTKKFKDIIRNNLDEDTYTIRQELKEYWKNKNDNNLFNQDLLNEAITTVIGDEDE